MFSDSATIIFSGLALCPCMALCYCHQYLCQPRLGHYLFASAAFAFHLGSSTLAALSLVPGTIVVLCLVTRTAFASILFSFTSNIVKRVDHHDLQTKRETVSVVNDTMCD